MTRRLGRSSTVRTQPPEESPRQVTFDGGPPEVDGRPRPAPGGAHVVRDSRGELALLEPD